MRILDWLTVKTMTKLNRKEDKPREISKECFLENQPDRKQNIRAVSCNGLSNSRFRVTAENIKSIRFKLCLNKNTFKKIIHLREGTVTVEMPPKTGCIATK